MQTRLRLIEHQSYRESLACRMGRVVWDLGAVIVPLWRLVYKLLCLTELKLAMLVPRYWDFFFASREFVLILPIKDHLGTRDDFQLFKRVEEFLPFPFPITSIQAQCAIRISVISYLKNICILQAFDNNLLFFSMVLERCMAWPKTRLSSLSAAKL